MELNQPADLAGGVPAGGQISGGDENNSSSERDATAAINNSGGTPRVEGRGGGRRTEGRGQVEGEGEGQDDWGETTTAITGSTSEAGFSVEDMSRLNRDLEDSIGFRCARYFGCVVAGVLGAVASLSPIVMIILPKIGAMGWETDPCRPDCEGQLISFTFKLVILAIGSWALFFRRPSATMPRILVFRSVVVLLVFILTVSYWLFYGLCILKVRDRNYPGIVSFCVSFVDGLLFIHYLAVILLEVRHLQQEFVVKVVRSPDGQSHCYAVGRLTIQQLAVWCLQQYYKDFEVYNPYLERYTRRASRISGFRIYNVDGCGSDTGSGRSRAVISARQRDSGHNDRFYEEQEYERRVRKRKARLISAAEEAFGHVKHLQQDKVGSVEMGPVETAQAIFPGLARPLQKYLRVTRQQPRYTLENILEHLATCITHSMSAKAFAERYLRQGPVIWNDKDFTPTQTWTISCTKMLNGSIHNGCTFRLQQADVMLLVTIRKLSHLSLTEDAVDQKNKFSIQLSSETPV